MRLATLSETDVAEIVAIAREGRLHIPFRRLCDWLGNKMNLAIWISPNRIELVEGSPLHDSWSELTKVVPPEITCVVGPVGQTQRTLHTPPPANDRGEVA